MNRFDIHNREKRFENRLEDIKNNEETSEEDKKIILKVKDERLSNNLSIDRVLLYLTKLKQLALRFDKNLKELEKKDVKEFIKKLNKGEIKKKDAGGNKTDEEYSAWGKQSYKLALKKLFQVGVMNGKAIGIRKKLDGLKPRLRRTTKRFRRNSLQKKTSN